MTGETIDLQAIPRAGSDGSRVGTNVVYLLVSQVATWTVTLATVVIAPRYLGPDGFGVVGFATAFVGFFTLAAGLGTGAYLTKTIARDSSAIGAYIYSGVAFKTVLGVVLSVAAIVLAWAIGTTGDALVLVAIGCVGMLFTVINEVFIGAMAGMEWMGRPAMWSTLQIWVASALGIAVVLAGGGVVAYGTVFAAAMAIPMVANGRAAWFWTTGTRRFDAAAVRRIVRGGAPLMVLSALTLVYGTINIPILTGIAGETTTGWLTLAGRFVGIPVFIVTAATTAFFPSFSAHGVGRPDDFARQVNRAIRLVVVVSVPAAVGLAVIAEDLIGLLYDWRYDGTVPIMQILAIQIPVMAVDVILATALIASDRQNQYLVVAGLAAAISPIAGVVAIHWSVDQFDNGGIGVAIVTVATEVLILVGALLLRSKGVMDRATWWMCLRCLLAGGAVALAVWAMGGFPLGVRVVIGALVYGIASLALGTVTPADIRRGLAIVTSATARIRRDPGSEQAVDSMLAAPAISAVEPGREERNW